MTSSKKIFSLTALNILISGLLFVGVFLFSESASAQTSGIVDSAGCTGIDCSACHLVNMGNGIITWIIGFLVLMFAVLMVIAGFGLVTSGGNPAAKTAAKEKFINALIGILIVLSAWLMIDTIIRGLVSEDGYLTGSVSGRFFWSDVQCTPPIVPERGDQVSIDMQRLNEIRQMCSAVGMSYQEARANGCALNACTTTSCLTGCASVVTAPDRSTYCATGPTNLNEAARQTCSTQGITHEQATEAGCNLNSCTGNCLTSCSNVVTDSSDNNYCASAPEVREVPPSTGSLVTIDGYEFDASIANNVRYIRDTFGLRVTSGYRDPERNRRVGGAERSHHLTGRAVDFVGSEADMQRAATWCRAQGNVEVLIHSVSSGRHLHCAWR